SNSLGAAISGQGEYMASEVIVEVLPPDGTIVPSGDWQFRETPYEPDPNLTRQQADLLPFDDLLTCVKKSGTKAVALGKVHIMCHEALIARFKEAQTHDENGQFLPRGVTLPKAFAAIGLNYETERKRYQRWVKATKTPKLPAPQRPTSVGQFVENADGKEFVFIGKELGKAKIIPLGGSPDDATTVPTISLVRRPVKKIKFNDLVLCTDDGKLYRYTDN